MKYLRFLSLFAVLTWFCSCEEDMGFTLDPVIEEEVIREEPATTHNDLSTSYQLLLDQVNSLRTSGCSCGTETMPPVSPVRWNANLATAALRHSRDMNTNSHFSHTGTDGSNAGQRITAAGYNWRTYGENIAFGYATATAVFNGWKNSPGHCRNLMNAAFTEMGAADQDSYWSQEFGTQRD